MRHGTCAKCASTTIRAAANGVQLGEHPHAQLRPQVGPGFRGIVRNHLTDIWSFACTTCGYVEMYLLDPEATAFIEQQWAPVPTTPQA